MGTKLKVMRLFILTVVLFFCTFTIVSVDIFAQETKENKTDVIDTNLEFPIELIVGEQGILDLNHEGVLFLPSWSVSNVDFINLDYTWRDNCTFTALKAGEVTLSFKANIDGEFHLETYLIKIIDNNTANDFVSNNIHYINKYKPEGLQEFVDEKYIDQGYTDFTWSANNDEVEIYKQNEDSVKISLSSEFYNEKNSIVPSVTFKGTKETIENGRSVKIVKNLYTKYYVLEYDDITRPDISEELENGLKPGELSIFKDAKWVSTDEMIAEISFDIQGVPLGTGSDIIVILDNSGSMDEGIVGVIEDNDPFVIAQDSVAEFANGLLKNNNVDNHRIAFIEFSTDLNDAFMFVNNLDSFNTSFYDATHITYSADHVQRDMPYGQTNYKVALQQAELYFEILSLEEQKEPRPKHIVFVSDGLPNEDYEGIEEANRLKDKDVLIHTIGIKLDNKGRQGLENITTTDVYDVQNLETELTPVFKSIASGIRYVATNTVITDYLSNDFVLVDSEKYPLKDNISTNDGDEVIIDIGTVTSHTEPVSFYVQYIGENDGELHRTNEAAFVEYDDIDGNESLKMSENQRGDEIIEGEERYTGLDSPLLPVPTSGMINIAYYYLDDSGDAFISESDDNLSTLDMSLAKSIRSIYRDIDGNQVLNLDLTYTINGIAPEGYRVVEKTIDGIDYTSSYAVTLSNDNLTPTVVFILEKEPEPTGLINIVYYYLDEAGTGFISADDETTSTTDISKAKKTSFVYEDSTNSSVLPLESTHKIVGEAPYGYKVVEQTINGIDYTSSYTVTINKDNLTPTVAFILENEQTPEIPNVTIPETGDTTSIHLWIGVMLVAGAMLVKKYKKHLAK